MERIGGIGWSSTSLDIMNRRTFVSDDKRPLELSHVLCIDSEVRLNGHLNMNTLWNIDERSA